MSNKSKIQKQVLSAIQENKPPIFTTDAATIVEQSKSGDKGLNDGGLYIHSTTCDGKSAPWREAFKSQEGNPNQPMICHDHDCISAPKHGDSE